MMNIKKYIYKFLGIISFFILFGTLDYANYFSLKRTVLQSGICISIIGFSALRYKTLKDTKQ